MRSDTVKPLSRLWRYTTEMLKLLPLPRHLCHLMQGPGGVHTCHSITRFLLPSHGPFGFYVMSHFSTLESCSSSCCCDETLGQKPLKEERVYFGSQLNATVRDGGKQAGHLSSAVGKPKGTNDCSASFLPLTQSQWAVSHLS